MVHLTLVGLSEDRARLLLVDDAGAEFTLGVDSHLRAALRGEHARLGQLEIEMDSALRPRDIQARIRAGETAEAVASAAKTTVDKIMAFAGPVLAERAHVAERAQRSSVRRRSAGEGPSRSSLGDAVTAHLHALNLSPDDVEWDSFRREDGRWTLTASYTTGRRKGDAHFAYDTPGNFVVPENDDAHWLVGDLAETAERPAAARKTVPQRRLASVPTDELPLGDDAIELVRDDAPVATASPSPPPEVEPDSGPEQPPVRTADLTGTAAAVRAAPGPGRAEPEESFFDAVFTEDGDEPAGAPESQTEDEPAQRPARKKGARASVPSWDEIMFGGGKRE